MWHISKGEIKAIAVNLIALFSRNKANSLKKIKTMKESQLIHIYLLHETQK